MGQSDVRVGVAIDINGTKDQRVRGRDEETRVHGDALIVEGGDVDQFRLRMLSALSKG